MKRFWMKSKVGDFLTETAHLTVAEVGAYHLLCMHYYIHSCLPAKEDAIRRISRMSSRQWSQSRDVLAALFDEGWRHKALDLEIQHVLEKSKVNSANARKSHTNRSKFAEHSQVRSQTKLHLKPDSLPSGEGDPPSPKIVENIGGQKRSLATALDPQWRPNAADAKVAFSYGMSESDIAEELVKFRAHHAERGSTSHDWSGSWLKWCARWNGKPRLIKPLTDGGAIATNKVHIKEGSPQWNAWQDHLKRTAGKGSPRDRNFGWFFDSEWPPGYPAGQQGAAA